MELSVYARRYVNINNIILKTVIFRNRILSLCALKIDFGNRALTYDIFDVCIRSYTIPLCLDSF
jgi:hypothetical protein